MPDEPELIYLEPDDEITSLVRRVRAAESRSVVVVAPGRSRATSSAVALRLLAQVAAEEDRNLSLVADPATRAVAGEAGIPAFASIAETTSGDAAPDAGAAAPRAPIHVVRGLSANAPVVPAAGLSRATPRSGPADETMAVRLPPRPARPRLAGLGGRPLQLPRWPWLAAPLVVILAVIAALLPAATLRIAPATVPVGPASYSLQLPIAGHQSEELTVTLTGAATGVRLEKIPAGGSVTFSNWNTVAVEVPEGTHVSVSGTIVFSTLKRIVVPRGKFQDQQPGQGSVAVVAVEPGLAGNVAAGAIDTIDDAGVRAFLRGFPDNPNRLVTNPDATAGGAETPHPVTQQSDVDAVVTAIQAELATQLAAALGSDPHRLYAGPPETEVPVIDVPEGLVGTEDTPTFELTGTLTFDRPYVARADVEQAAGDELRADTAAIPAGTTIILASINVQVGTATPSGDELAVQVTVTAASAAEIDKAAVRDLVAGMTRDEAKAALRDIGAVEVDLWPSWQDRLPRLSFRISVETVALQPDASPSP